MTRKNKIKSKHAISRCVRTYKEKNTVHVSAQLEISSLKKLPKYKQARTFFSACAHIMEKKTSWTFSRISILVLRHDH